MHPMDPSASEEMASQFPLGTIVYQSLLPKPPVLTECGFVIQNSLHCLRQYMIIASAAILYPQLQVKTKQTNMVFKLREDDNLDSLQTSLPHLKDSGIKVELNRDGDFYIELGGGWKSKWIKRFINQQVNHQIVASAQQPSHQPNAMKFFFLLALSFFHTNVLEAGNKASRTDYCAAAPLRQSKLYLAS